MISPEALAGTLRRAYDNGAQVLVHANGDGAIDRLLDAHEAAGAPQGRRTVVVHSQVMRLDQLDRYAAHGIVPSFFTSHTFFWGDVHLANLGPDRAALLSPTRSALESGLRFSNHSDFLVTPLDPMFILWSSVHRLSRTDREIGPGQRLTVEEGLRALTLDAAYQYFEEDRKGSIEPGKLADLVVLDANPTAVDGEAIRCIRVLETLKEGRTVFRLADDAGVPAFRRWLGCT